MNIRAVKRIYDEYIIPYTNDAHNIILFAVFFLIASLEMCQIYSAGVVSMLYYLLGIGFLLMLTIKSLIEKDLLLHVGYYILMICFEASFSITVISGLSSLSGQPFLLHGYIVILGNQTLIILQMIQMIYIYIVHSKEKKGWKQRKINREVLLLLAIVLCISVFTNLECMDSWARWDSYSYYNALSKLSIYNVFEGGKNGLIVCGHISTVFALFVMIVKAVSGMNLLNTLYLSNIILMVLDMMLFYAIIRKLIPTRKFLFYFLSSLLCGVSPYILGSVNAINMEHILLTSILLFIYGSLYKNQLICLLAVFAMCNTKEVGVVVAVFMMSASLLKAFICYYKSRISIDIGYFLCAFITGILWLLQYQKVDWAEVNQAGKNPFLDGTAFNTFSFSWLHISDTWKGEIWTNFTWIFVILFCFAVIKMIILRFNKHNLCRNEVFTMLWDYGEIMAGLAGFQLITCMFVTYHLYRYYAPFSILLYIIGIGSLEFLTKDMRHKEKMGNGILCFISILLILQSYYTIDPIMLKMFNTIDVGNGYLASLDVHITDFNEPAFHDSINYNRQIMYFDKAMDKALFLICPDESTVIVVSDEFYAKKGIEFMYEIWGHGSYSSKYIIYDNKKERRYLDDSSEYALQLGFISKETDVDSDYQLEKERVFYLEMPWENLAPNYLKQKYGDKFSLYGTVRYRGWVLNVYQFIA